MFAACCLFGFLVVWVALFRPFLKSQNTAKNVVYNYLIMSVTDWAGLILTVLSIIAITIGGIKWFVTAEIRILSTELKEDLSELKPNSGSSMKDQVSRLEEKPID